MQPPNADHASMTWLAFALMTVAAWGLYGVFLHSGQTFMKDPASGRYKAFLFVGIAYFLTAVIAPLVVLWLTGANWSFTPKGMTWSLLAGIVGAVGAFCVLLAFGAGGMPSVVMSIIFAGAPIVNAVVALSLHPPAGGFSSLRWQFVVGILLAALGGCLVSLYKPPPTKAAKAPATAEAPVETLPPAGSVTPIPDPPGAME
jgi:drug/metabolite transporter (DMT)-like permease